MEGLEGLLAFLRELALWYHIGTSEVSTHGWTTGRGTDSSVKNLLHLGHLS